MIDDATQILGRIADQLERADGGLTLNFATVEIHLEFVMCGPDEVQGGTS